MKLIAIILIIGLFGLTGCSGCNFDYGKTFNNNDPSNQAYWAGTIVFIVTLLFYFDYKRVSKQCQAEYNKKAAHYQRTGKRLKS